MFVKWSCGCVEIRIDDTQCIVIKGCDDTTDALGFETRDNSRMDFKQLSDNKAQSLMEKLQLQLLNGYKWKVFVELMDK